MNRSLLSIPAGWRALTLLCYVSCFLFATPVWGQTPLFLDQAPPDEMVDCFGDVPNGNNLRAVVLNIDGLLDTVRVSPVDEISDPNAPCVGGFITRTWTVTDDIGTATESQTITFGAAGEDDGPSIEMSLLPVMNDTVDCRSVNDPLDPDSYVRWLSDRRIAVATAARIGCAPISSVSDNAPTTLEGYDCNDRLEVTFVVEDLCGRLAAVDFTYVTVDTVGPVIIGVTNDTLRLSCADPIPPEPMVTVEDCDTIPTLIFTPSTTQLLDGSCREYDYDIVRNYLATDACGNMTSVTSVIEVRDVEPPNFRRPPTQNLSCTQDPFDLNLTGRPTDLGDNCTPVDSLEITFTDDVISDVICGNSFNVRRTWRVSDRCGNSRVRIQEIRVRDTENPTFTPPTDTVRTTCANFPNVSSTDPPTDLFDNCDETVNLTFEDVIVFGSCPGNFTVDRTWRIFDDCGNDLFTGQHIIVTDTTAPVFTTMPEDLVTSCNGGFGATSQEIRYNNWLADFAGARFTDGCTVDDNLQVDIFESGTTNFPVFPDISCAEGDGVVRRMDVDIIVTDQCGNSNMVSVQYRQIDELAIRLLDCPESQAVPTDPGRCDADVSLPPPVFQDQCASSLPFQLMLRDSAEFTSAANNPGQLGTVPVDPIILNLVIDAELPVNALTRGILTIELENADAEGEEEYFFIFGEDGTLLGTTERADFQCEDVVTIDTIPAFLFNQYARDGVVTIRLEPNILPDRPGTFAINNLCPGGGRVWAHLLQPVVRLTDITYEVDIDGNGFNVIDPIDTVFTNLDLGLHQITYRATDCGGNMDECLFTITVEDREPPVVTCPDDVEVILDSNTCQVTLTLDLPVEVTDNCEPYTLETREGPVNTADRFFPFFFDPNLNTFQAGEITIRLEDVPTGILDSVDFDIFMTGQFSNRGAWLDVLLPDDTLLASSERGVATCEEEGMMRLRLSAADVLANLADDGSLTLHLRPRPVSVPPGQEGDGIIPCDPDSVGGDGSSDGVTQARIVATFRSLYPDYFTTGATITPRSSTSPDNPRPVVTFNQGVTDFSYIVTDQGGNMDTCTIAVTVIDTIAPMAVCQATTVFVDPSGLSPVTVPADAIDGGSSDNCGLQELRMNPATFSCTQYDEIVPVTLTVLDPSGNVDSCSTIVSIAPLAPEPAASTNVCGGDTLFLFANPPTQEAPGQTIYTYRWFDPTGALISTEKNPAIPGVSEDDNGAYRVEIRGLSGCASEGVVVVSIGTFPAAPTIEAPARVCLGDEVPLTSVSGYPGSVSYEWYRGQPGAGVLLGASNTATFSAPFGPGSGEDDFYAVVFVNGCPSPPSNVVSVGTAARPQVQTTVDNIEVCELESVTLSATTVTGVTYEWTGPNEFFATGRNVEIESIGLEGAGTYFVRTVRSEGCFSLPDSIVVTITEAAAGTSLSGDDVICPGDILSLEAGDASGNAYVFLGPDGQEIESAEATLTLSPATEAFIGEWRVRIRRDECFSAPSDPFFVSLGTAPEATATTLPDPICLGNDLVLQGSSNIAGSNYRWEGPNDFQEENIAPVISDVTELANGTYYLTVTSPTGCFAVDSVEVDILPGLLIDSVVVSSGRCLNGGEPVSLSARISPAPGDGETYTYEWSGPEGTSSSEVFEIPNVSLASNGTYTLRVTNETGCRSQLFSIPVEFDFAPSAPVTPFTPDGSTGLCVGEDLMLQTNDFGDNVTYIWLLPNGTNFPTMTNVLNLRDVDDALSGTFTVRVVRNGCTSLPSEGREITITAFPEINLTVTSPVCEGQEINFQITDLAGATYSWQGPSNFSSSIPNPTIGSADEDVHAGKYTVVASLNGCLSDTLSTDVSVSPTPRAPVAQPITPVCISDPDAILQLRVNPNTNSAGADYQWYIQNGQTPVGNATESLLLEVTDFSLFTGGGLFEFSVRAIVGGCESELSSPVTVRLDEAGDGEEADAGRDTIICAGLHLLEAAAFSTGSGRWTLVQGTGDITIVNPGSRTTAVQGLTEFGGPYQFAWTLSSGSCLAYAADTVMLTVTDGEAAMAGDNIIACLREETRLNATAPVQNGSGGRWSQGLAQEILGVVIEDPLDPNTLITGLQPDNVYSFTWTVTSNCGVKEENVLVNVSDPSPDAGDDFTACNQDRSVELVAAAPTLGSIGRWRALDAGTNIADPESRTTEVSGLQEGENRFVWEVDEGLCGDRSRDTVVVFFAEPPKPRDDAVDTDFQAPVSFNPGENDENPAGATISIPRLPAEGGDLVDNGDGSFTYTPPANFVGEIAIEYLVTSMGCTNARAFVFVRIGKDVNCEAPNIFTPNSDGMNDTFVVPCLLDTRRFPESQVTIYNQWGDEVFRSEMPYRNDWDGTYQGSALPVGTYFYIIDFGGDRDSDSGDVRIER